MSNTVRATTPRPFKVGALFAGYGGLEIGVSQVLDAEPAWFAEFEPAPSRILAQRFPGVPNLGDVTKVDWSAVEPVDIITGGSPCQDLSHAGKRAGMKAGTRSGLWASMCDAIDIIRPRFVVWENVRGALSAAATAGDVETCDFCVGDAGDVHLRALGRVLGDLAELGYDAAWHGLRAADVGAPHGRWRVFVLAWPAADTDGFRHERDRPARDGRDGSADGGQHPVALLPTPTTTQRGTDANASTREQAGPNLHNAVALLPTPRATDGTKGGPNQRGSSGDLMLPSAVTQLDRHDGPTCGEPTRADVFAGIWCACERGASATLLPTPTSTDHKASGASYAATDTHHTGITLTDATVRQPERFGAYAPAIARWEAILGRPAPTPTEPTGKDGAHRLSPRFVEWMQGLPDGWVTDTGLTRNEQLKALGNGVVPQQGAAALRHLLAVREMAIS